ncbi:DUF6427 family protein [Salinimicrobium flavum]|uniref:DUF6427 family protein n=1 Tax=Salinimicrobium flavum TaxID=1737065 RepID=A0ABW5IXE8_9FLAO
MLTSFFSKSRPINFVVVAVYMSVFYLIANFPDLITSSFLIILKEMGVLLLFLVTVLLLNFISKRNELTSRNAYKTVLFAAFCCMFFAALKNDAAIVANLLVLLALRRIISLKSQRETVQKIFDATFWIGIASLFYFWSILFLFIVYFGILVHVGYRFKNWLVPPVAVLTLLSLVTATDLLITDTFYTFSEWFQDSNFDFTAYREPGILIPVAFLFALTIWASFFYMGIIQKASANTKTSLFIILLFTALSLGVAVLAPTKDSSELIFFFAPLAIIVTNYFQVSDDKWFREIILGVVILLPVLLLLFF